MHYLMLIERCPLSFTNLSSKNRGANTLNCHILTENRIILGTSKTSYREVP